MTIQLSVAVRNAQLDAIETTAGVSAILKIFTGSQPANCAASDSGTVLLTYNLASDWADAASGGVKNFSGTPLSATASATGTAAHFRLYQSDGSTCVMQGSVGTSGADLTIDNASVSSGKTYSVTSWPMTAGGA